MKKILMFLLLGMFLISLVSALEFDNSLKYSNNDLKVNFKNAFGFGEDLGTAELKSHKSVTEVKDVCLNSEVEGDVNNCAVTMYYDFSFNKLYKNGFGEVSFTDMRTGKEIERDFRFVYWGEEEYQSPVYFCSNVLSKNGTISNECEITSYETKIKEKWLPYNSKDIPKGNIRIGIETEVKINDYVDGVWTIAGKKVKKHISWSADLNTDLVAYYKLENLEDAHASYDLTNNGATGGVNGKIINAYDFDGETDYMVNILLPFTNDFSFSLWMKPEDMSGTYAGVFASNSSIFYNEFGFRRSSDNSYELLVDDASGRAIITAGNFTEDGNHWYHIVGTYNQSQIALYLNGELLSVADEVDAINVEGVFIGKFMDGGSYEFKGVLDEIGIWDRSLNQDEVEYLYSSGDACAYGNDNCNFCPTTLNSPEDNANLTSQTTIFNCTGSDDINLVNVSLYLNGILNETNSSGANNTDYIFTKILSPGNYNWTCSATDNENSTKTASYRDFNVLINSISYIYNTTTYETAEETLKLNLSQLTDTITNVKLFYNGTEYSTTEDEGIYAKTLQINKVSTTTNNSFYWRFTNGGNTINTESYNQTINPIILTLCNATYNVPFINFTFKNEGDLSTTTGQFTNAEFEYWLGDGSITETYQYINNTNHSSYAFCFSPSERDIYVDNYIQYKNDESPQRIYDPSAITLTDTTTNQILYLLSTEDGIYVTFQVVNTGDVVLSGVSVNATRLISGETVVVGKGITGDDGSVTFWLNPDFTHTFIFSKVGYTTYTTSFAPTQPSYTITLGGGTIVPISFYKGITKYILPKNESLVNDTTYTFGFQLNSSYWDVEEYGFNLRLNNGTEITGGSTVTEGILLTKNYNTANSSRIYLEYYWIINGTTISDSLYWNIFNTAYTQWSIKTFFTDLNLYINSGLFGIDDFGKKLLIFLILFISIGTLSYKYGINDPIFLSALTFGVIFFFDVALGIIPPYTLMMGGTEKVFENFYTFIAGLILAVFVVRGVSG